MRHEVRGAAARAALACPDALDVDALGNVFVADRCNGRIRRIDARSGVITTVAGNGGEGPSPDGRAVQMALAGVFYVRVANDDALLFTDTEAHLVRELDLRSGQVRTVAGNGMQGFTGDGGPALEASLSRPQVALRLANGDLLIGDSFNHRDRVVDAASGTIRTIAGNGEEAPAVGGAMATESPLMYFGDIHEQPDGSLIWSEWGSSQVVRLDRTTGRLEVVAGNTTFDRADADGPAAGPVDQPQRALDVEPAGRTPDRVGDRQPDRPKRGAVEGGERIDQHREQRLLDADRAGSIVADGNPELIVCERNAEQIAVDAGFELLPRRAVVLRAQY